MALDFGKIALARIVETIMCWTGRASQRRALAKLDRHLLKDIGVSKEAADRESRMPFWVGDQSVDGIARHSRREPDDSRRQRLIIRRRRTA